MFKRMIAKIESGGQPNNTPMTAKHRQDGRAAAFVNGSVNGPLPTTPPKFKKRKADNMADKGDEDSTKGRFRYYDSTLMLISLTIGIQSSRVKAYLPSLSSLFDTDEDKQAVIAYIESRKVATISTSSRLVTPRSKLLDNQHRHLSISQKFYAHTRFRHGTVLVLMHCST